MSMQTLERAILAEAKIVTNNNKLKMKDIMEWSTGGMEIEEDEVLFRLPDLKINIAIKKT